jgi:SAM-dependent methyltransferase
MTLRMLPLGHKAVPPFDDGWVVGPGKREPYLSFVGVDSPNWSAELEGLHDESSRAHFIDIRTRSAILERIEDVPPTATIADLGCSTGYLLEDIRASRPDCTLFGVDAVASGLRKAHTLVPTARLLQADVCELPFPNAALDAVVSANLLEHVPDDLRAIREIARVLRARGTAVMVVPAGPRLYDYYDRFLGHQRRYGRRELASRVRSAGLRVLDDAYIGSLLYPAFWLVKQRNRRRYDHLRGHALRQRVAQDIAGTKDSRFGSTLCSLERRLRLRLPFGIRNIVVAQKP